MQECQADSLWETDSDAELDERYVVIVEAQRQWVVDTFDRTAGTRASDSAEERTGLSDAAQQ